jgi:thymidylate kinase
MKAYKLSNIIAFSGTDGAGKSTQIALVKIFFESRDYKVKVLWSRGGYTPIFSNLKKFLRIVSLKKIPKSGKSIIRSRLLDNSLVSNIWLSIAIIDLIILYGLYLRLLRLIGYVVICDRYIKDTEIDFIRNFPNTFNQKSFLWRLLLKISVTPGRVFLLHIPVELSLERSDVKNEPFPDTPETLAFRLESYLDDDNFPSDKYFKIDCQKSIQDVYLKIEEELKEIF